jgi:hypothetical protein
MIARIVTRTTPSLGTRPGENADARLRVPFAALLLGIATSGWRRSSIKFAQRAMNRFT